MEDTILEKLIEISSEINSLKSRIEKLENDKQLTNNLLDPENFRF